MEEQNTITFKYICDSDLIDLYFVKKYLDTRTSNRIFLRILYMPYSRMDRVENDSAFTLKYVCDFINLMNFCRIDVYEPHSDMTSGLLNNCVVINMSAELFDIYNWDMNFNKDTDYIYFPDAGADKRYSKLIKGYKTLVGFKKRDFKTGDILGLEIFGDTDLNGARVVIIDDLSSAGGTFYFGAKKLKEIGAGDIYLVVTHCEDTIHKGELLKTDYIKQIFTTNSILTMTHEKIKVMRIL